MNENAQVACQSLLETAWEVLERHQVGGVVVGGWAAKTFNADVLPHPGTLDVDILLPPESLDSKFPSAVEELLCKHEFLKSAKSGYQLAKVFPIEGRDTISMSIS